MPAGPLPVWYLCFVSQHNICRRPPPQSAPQAAMFGAHKQTAAAAAAAGPKHTPHHVSCNLVKLISHGTTPSWIYTDILSTCTPSLPAGCPGAHDQIAAAARRGVRRSGAGCTTVSTILHSNRPVHDPNDHARLRTNEHDQVMTQCTGWWALLHSLLDCPTQTERTSCRRPTRSLH